MYDQFASDYDRFNNWENRLAAELPFIENMLASIPRAGEQPLRILDSACGTGMHAIALAKRGYQVSAADLSAPMIEKARANAAGENVALRFEAVGFGSLAAAFGARSADALLCLGNSLPHVLASADLRSALADFAHCLRSGGLLLIQNRNFDAVMASRQRWMDPQSFHDDEHEWVFVRFYDFESDGTVRFNMVTLKRTIGGDWQSKSASTRLAPQLQGDLHQALLTAGFSKVRAFGSMSGEAFAPSTSGNLILAAAKE
jgi:glycine/sarcosine N-methyltransferase